MYRRFTTGTLAASLAFAAIGAHAASADQPGWYAGLDLGRSHLKLSGSDIDRAFAGQGITSSSSIDHSHSGWGLDLGYRFGPHFALEGGYTDLGKFAYSAPTTAPGADTIGGHYKAHAWWLAPEGILPLGERAALFGKAGITHATADLSAASSTGATAPASASHSNAGWLLGAGGSYDFTRSVYGKLEWDRYGRVGSAGTTGRGDVDLFTAGVGLRF